MARSLSVPEAALALGGELSPRIAQGGLLQVPTDPAALAQTPAVQGVAIQVVLEGVAAKAGRVQAALLALFARVARRHINEIKSLPPPATVAARSIQHLLGESAMASGALAQWREIVGQAARDQLASWTLGGAGSVALGGLERPYSGPAVVATQTICNQLWQDLRVTAGLAAILAELQEAHIRALAPLASGKEQWVSLRHTETGLRLAHGGVQALGEIRLVLQSLAEAGPRLQDLIYGHLDSFVTDLGAAFQSLEICIERLELCDRHWCARIFSSAGGGAFGENALVITALCNNLKCEGENHDDIENFARSLMNAVTAHGVSVLGLLESEIQDHGPKIAPQSITRAMRYVKYDDKDCPVSVAHKSWITAELARAEAAAALLGKQ
jgi:hypothetical protein